MAVTVDNTGTVVLSSGAVTQLNVTFTVSASATAIWAGLETDTGVTAVACHLNPSGVNQAFTQIGTATVPTGGQQVYAFGLINPAATGSVTVRFTWTTAAVSVCDAQSYLGTATASVANTFYNNNTATGSTGTTSPVTITSQTGDLVVGIMASDNTVSSPSGTTIWVDNVNSDDAAHYASGAATVTLTTTVVGGFDWCHQGCSVRQSGATTTYTGFDDGQNQTYQHGNTVGWRAAAFAKGDDGIQSPFVIFIPNDWDTHPFQPQPPPTPRGRNASIMVGDQGTQATFIRFLPNDWDTHPFQPPHASPERRYAAVVQKDEGIEFPFIRFLPNDWDTHPPQPPHPRPERVGALFGGDQGNEAKFIRFFPYGWEIPSPQPPHPRPERVGAIMPSEPGIEAKFVPPVTLVWGWESPISTLVRRIRPVSEFGDQGIVANFINFIAYGWEVSPFQPSHPRVEKAASWLIGDQGIEAPFINWLNAGWEIPSLQPPHPRPERAGSIMPSETGIEAVFVPPATITWGWEIQPHQPAIRVERRYPGIRGSSQFPIFSTWLNTGWEIPSPQPPHPRPERAASSFGGSQGTDAQFINWLNAGWEIPSFQPSHPRPERSGAIAISEPGIEAQYVFVPPTTTWGWETVPPILRQALVNRYPAIEGRSDFAAFTFQPYGWEIAPFQPPHPAPERRYPGIKGSSQFPIFSTWINLGWEVPSFQPSHPRPERVGTIPFGDQGTLFPIVAPTIFIEGWQILPFQPPHPRPERNAAWMIGDQGTQAQFNVFLPWGWEIPSPFLTRFAVFKKSPEYGDEGTYAPYVFVPPPAITLILRTLMGYGL